MESCVEVEISYDEKEVKKAISFFILKINRMKAYFLIVYPIIVIATIVSLIYSEYIVLSPVFISSGFLFYYFYYTKPIDAYIKFYKKRKGGTYRFSENNVLITSEEVHSSVSWRVFKKAFEIPSAFLLIDDNKFVYIFQKNCFSKATEIELFRNHLKKNIEGFKLFQ